MKIFRDILVQRFLVALIVYGNSVLVHSFAEGDLSEGVDLGSNPVPQGLDWSPEWLTDSSDIFADSEHNGIDTNLADSDTLQSSCTSQADDWSLTARDTLSCSSSNSLPAGALSPDTLQLFNNPLHLLESVPKTGQDSLDSPRQHIFPVGIIETSGDDEDPCRSNQDHRINLCCRGPVEVAYDFFYPYAVANGCDLSTFILQLEFSK